MVQIFQSVYSPHHVILRREGSGVSDLTFEKNKTELLAVRTLVVYISVKFCFRILKLSILPDATHESIKIQILPYPAQILPAQSCLYPSLFDCLLEVELFCSKSARPQLVSLGKDERTLV